MSEFSLDEITKQLRKNVGGGKSRRKSKSKSKSRRKTKRNTFMGWFK